MYGGDGKSTFALPNLQGSAAMHPDDNQFPQGAQGGSQTVTLLRSEMPAHNHIPRANNQEGTTNSPKPTNPLSRSEGGSAYQAAAPVPVQMDPTMIAPAGGSLPHNNMQPYLTLNFNIAMQGVFPPRG